MATRKATFQVCDNPECTTETEVDDQEPMAWGIYIDRGSFHTNGGGGPLNKIYACTLGCLSEAVRASIAEEWGEV